MHEAEGKAAETPVQTMSAARATATWALLVLATIGGWLLSGGGAAGDAPRMAALIVIGCAKIYCVMAVFMGLWDAPRRWHLGAIAWVVVTGLAIFLAAGGAGA